MIDRVRCGGRGLGIMGGAKGLVGVASMRWAWSAGRWAESLDPDLSVFGGVFEGSPGGFHWGVGGGSYFLGGSRPLLYPQCPSLHCTTQPPDLLWPQIQVGVPPRPSHGLHWSHLRAARPLRRLWLR